MEHKTDGDTMSETAAQRVFDALTRRVIAVPPAFCQLAGSVTAGLMLAQAVYWQQRTVNRKYPGWFYKSADDWTEEITLTRHEQSAARSKLRALTVYIGGEEHFVWKEQLRGVPATLYYQVDMRALRHAIAKLPQPQIDAEVQDEGEDEIQFAEKRESSLPKSANPVSRKAANWIDEKRETNSESTTEISAKSKANNNNAVVVSKPKALTAEEQQQRDWLLQMQNVTDDAGWMLKPFDADMLLDACADYGLDAVIGALGTARDARARSPIAYAMGVLKNKHPAPAPPPALPSTVEEYIWQQAVTMFKEHERDGAISWLSASWAREWEEKRAEQAKGQAA